MSRRWMWPALLWVVAGCYLSSPVSDRDRVSGPDGDGFPPDDVAGRDADATATEGENSPDARADGDDADPESTGDDGADGGECVAYDPTRLCGPWDCSCSPPTERPCPAECEMPTGDCARGIGVWKARMGRLMPGEMDLPDFPGWTFRHDATEILVAIGWNDCKAAAGCSDHCASMGDRGYVIDAASGAVLYAMRSPWGSMPREGAWPPSPCRPTDPAGGCTSECPGGEPPCVPFGRFPDEWMIPEGCEPSWGIRASQHCCEVLVPDFDMRYSMIHPCNYTDDYPGLRDGYWYGAIGRNRISTGEWLPPIDLPLVEDVVVF